MRPFVRKFTYALLLIFLFNIQFTFAEVDHKQKIKNAIIQYLDSRFLNATFMFASNNSVLAQGAYGVYSLYGDQLTVKQIMPIASGTKPIVAAMLLRLQERGKLNVHDKVSQYLDPSYFIWDGSNVPDWADKITLHDLLIHTSGLPEYCLVLEVDRTKSHDAINKEIVRFASEKGVDFPPGAKFEYSNTNFVVLGLIIEKVTGQTLPQLLEEEFFKPLNMTSTYLASLDEAIKVQSGEDESKYPSRYFVQPSLKFPIFSKAESKFFMVPYADGGIISNVKDMIKWHRALHQGKLLSEESYKLMLTKHVLAEDKTLKGKCYSGYGIFIGELENGDLMFYHQGRSLGVRSESGYVPARDFYYAILSNVITYIPKGQAAVNMDDPKNQLDIRYFRDAILEASK